MINKNGRNKLTDGVHIHEELYNFRAKMLATFFDLLRKYPLCFVMLCCGTCMRSHCWPLAGGENPSPASERFCGDLAPGRRSGCVISKQRKSICAGEVISLIDHDA
jgi:hypothetical protein